MESIHTAYTAGVAAANSVLAAACSSNEAFAKVDQFCTIGGRCLFVDGWFSVADVFGLKYHSKMVLPSNLGVYGNRSPLFPFIFPLNRV